MQPKQVSKREFAEIIGVSPGRVSQYIAAGQITAASMVGIGQRAKIDVERAKAELRLTLDVGQRFSNGIDTRLEPASEFELPPGDPLGADRSIDHDIKLQKLEQLKRANRNAAAVEANNAGHLIETAAARASAKNIICKMVAVFDSSISPMAAALAQKFALPIAEVEGVLHLTSERVRAQAIERAGAVFKI